MVLVKTRRIDKELDLPELSRWYREQGWEDFSDIMFPPLGFMVDDYAAVWLFKDEEAKFGWISWMVVNPRKNLAIAFKALHFLYERVEQESQQLGLKLLTCTVSHSSLKKLADQHNYVKGDMGLTSYWKSI